ncbi:TetR/AcrR family transcriptional regulator [Sinomonas halotolerans]|uniref:TetR/AcrR family transcriptional regulator n=1 Tax=Sinomonas halotolerans TaxID=1644133 RepID=A0ABU9WY41_9MICC
MARPPRPERKTELLEQILDYLLDSTLADLTFRSLADGLGISSYVLVYHFGNREQLVGEIIRGIVARFDGLFFDAPGNDAPKTGTAALIQWARAAFALALDHRGRHLQRLEFEAAVQDVVAEEPRRLGLEAYQKWHRLAAEWLARQGVPEDRAAVLGRTYVNAIMGVLYDYVLTGDRDAALASYDVVMATLPAQLEQAASAEADAGARPAGSAG